MQEESWNLALGRLLIAAAWADGKLDEQERLALRDLLFRLPALSPEEWNELEREIEDPADQAERNRRLEALLLRTRDDEDRHQAMKVLRELARSEALGESEERAVNEILMTLEEPSEETSLGLLGRLKSALQDPIRRRAAALRDYVGQEQQLEDDLESRVRARWPSTSPPPASDTLHRLCVGAAILAHVADLDDRVEEGEVAAMVRALQEHWKISEAAADIVVELALEESSRGLDLYSLLRDFFESTDEEERKRFLAAVFQVAAGDGTATYDEIEEIRRIGRGLLLSHHHFIEAKLRLPEDERET